MDVEPVLERLRAEFPGWRFGMVWQTANSGPDARSLTASRGGVLLSAPDAAALAEKIRREEAGG